MKKVIVVDGMHCDHCKGSVEKALSSIVGVVSAKVDLKKKSATVTLSQDVGDEALKAAVIDAGFIPVSISDKKGLFG